MQLTHPTILGNRSSFSFLERLEEQRKVGLKKTLKTCFSIVTEHSRGEDGMGKTRQLDGLKTRVIDEAEVRQRRINGTEEDKRERLNQSE